MTEAAQASGAGSEPETQGVDPPANGPAGEKANGDSSGRYLIKRGSVGSAGSDQLGSVGRGSIGSLVSAQDRQAVSELRTEKIKRDLRVQFTAASAKHALDDHEESTERYS